MIQPVALPTVRIFLFKPERLDMFHLRLAISLSSLRCDVQVIDQDAHGLRRACLLARTRADLPQLVLFQYDRERSRGGALLRSLRASEEFRELPLVVIGDGEDPMSARLAYRDGADAFLPLPTRGSELAHTGRDIERFWRDRSERQREIPLSSTPRQLEEQQAS